MKTYTIPNTDVIEVAMLSNIMLGSPKDLEGGGDDSKPLKPWGAPGGSKPF